LFDARDSGDEVIAMDDLWGTYRLFTKIYKDSGTIPFVNMNDMEKFKSLINENTKLVSETPTNPMMK
jgi:cystathionine beta-lyase